MGLAPPPSDSLDLSAISRGAWGTFVYGNSRPALLRFVYALARANDPNPTWVDLQDAAGDPTDSGPGELGWIPEDRLFLVAAPEARPQDGIANAALWAVVRSDEPRAVLGSLTDFLRLPPMVQDAVSRVGSDTQRPVFAVVNGDRAREYYPRDPAGVRPIVDAMLHAGVLPIFAAVGPPGDGRGAFDFVFELRVGDLRHWSEGSLHCERAPADSAVAAGATVPLVGVAHLREFMEAGPGAPP